MTTPSEPTLMYVEDDGILYRGADRYHPSEIWHYGRKCWVPFHGGAQDPGWGAVVDAAHAEVLKFDSPGAAHYMYYDVPPWRQPTSDEYWRAVMPPMRPPRDTGL